MPPYNQGYQAPPRMNQQSTGFAGPGSQMMQDYNRNRPPSMTQGNMSRGNSMFMQPPQQQQKQGGGFWRGLGNALKAPFTGGGTTNNYYGGQQGGMIQGPQQGRYGPQGGFMQEMMRRQPPPPGWQPPPYNPNQATDQGPGGWNKNKPWGSSIVPPQPSWTQTDVGGWGQQNKPQIMPQSQGRWGGLQQGYPSNRGQTIPTQTQAEYDQGMQQNQQAAQNQPMGPSPEAYNQMLQQRMQTPWDRGYLT